MGKNSSTRWRAPLLALVREGRCARRVRCGSDGSGGSGVRHGERPRRLGRVLLAGMLCVLLGACGNVRLAYDHADTLILLWADHYADFTQEQEQQLIKPRLRELLAWHRAVQLPDYARMLTRVATRLDPARGGRGEVSGREVLAFEDEFRASFLVLAERALPDLAELALALQPEQIERIDRKMGDAIEKYRKEAIGDPANPSMVKRADRAIDRAEDWLGRLARTQRDQVRAAAGRLLLPHAVLLEERQERRRELVALLRRVQRDRPPREAVITALRGYTTAVIAPPGDPAHERRRALSASNAELTAVIVNLATPEQRSRAVDKLQGWIDDFQQLAARKHP